MADSENRRPLTTQQLRALEEAKNSSGGKTQGKVQNGVTSRTSDGRTGKIKGKTSDNNDGKKKRRGTKKQARRTVAGLLLASALVVCAIPVQETKAVTPFTSPDAEWVRSLNYTSYINEAAAWETVDSAGHSDTYWQSKVPLVNPGNDSNGNPYYPVYTTSTKNNTVQYMFCFVPVEPGLSQYVAVILGVDANKIKDNTLTIESKVSAFKKYSWNTSTTDYCAVSMDDSYLYYLYPTQRMVGTTGYYKVLNNAYPVLNPDPTYNDIPQDYYYTQTTGSIPGPTSPLPTVEGEDSGYLKTVETVIKDTTKNPVEYNIQVETTTYVGEAYEDTSVDPAVTAYRWKEVNDKNTYLLEESTIEAMNPCYDSREDVWGPLGDTALYYFTGTGNPDLTQIADFAMVASNTDKLRIHDVDVTYIGQQTISDADNDGVWTIDAAPVTEADPTRGVFAGLTNVTTVNIPSTLVGIGDCAFYGGNIKSVNFDSSGIISTIGNSAFANCRSLETVNIPTYSRLNAIGRNAFYKDYALTGFTVPTSIHAIGDYAFAECSGLQYIDFSNAIYMDAIGYHAFENCTSLIEINFPEKFLQDSPGLPGQLAGDSYSIVNKIPIDTFKGCINLKHITMNNNLLDISDGTNYSTYEDEATNHARRASRPADDCDIDNFLESLTDKDEFYFEGAANGGWAIYDTAKEHCISYKHLGEDIYERVVECNESPSHNNVFTVNGEGEILNMEADPDCSEIIFPRKIGKIGIKTIRGTLFNNKNKCNIKKVVIPSSIELIEAGAFEGCHQLESVLFITPDDPYENPNLVIEDGAFATQQVSEHHTTCSTHGALEKTPYLSFTGTISDTSAPFLYAMNPANNINNGTQTADTYITFFSGWPSNLTVQYNPKTGKNTLIDVPKYSELSSIDTKEIVIKKWVTDHYEVESTHKLPYLTTDMINAASTAVSHFEHDVDHPGETPTTTGDEKAVIDSALNIILPPGIEAIQTGLFSNLNTDGSVCDSSAVPDYMINSITMYTVEEIEPYAFAGLNNANSGTKGISKGLAGFVQNESGCRSIGDYAFRNCKSLIGVNLAASVESIGLRPFMGCDSLTGVDFNSGSNYSCSNQIIYGMEDGLNTHIVECLECRGGTAGNALVGPSELADVKSMADEAFMDCDSIGQVDLSTSKLGKVSERGFALMDNLGSVKLPEDFCKSIGRGAFWSSNVYYIEVPNSVTLIQPEAFALVNTTDVYNRVITKSGSTSSGTYFAEGDSKDQFVSYKASGEPEYGDNSSHKIITAYCVEDSAMDVYSEDYAYINPEYYRPTIMHTVYFWDTYFSTTDPVLVDTKQVADGESAIPPEFPVHSGISATGWTPNYTNIVRDTDVSTVYSDTLHEVWFTSTDLNTGETTILTEHQFIEDGKSAIPPAENPSCEGYVFKGWKPDYRNIYHDGAIVAWFAAASDKDKHTVSFFNQDGSLYLKFEVADGGELTTIPTGPNVAGYTFKGWAPNDFTNITKDISAVGIYEKIIPSPSPNPTGKDPSSSPTASPTPTNGNNNNATVKTYTCTVSGGSGTGSYIAGQVVPINAYDMGEGQVFDRWTTSTGGVAFGNATNPTTYFTMPANNVAITATFKTGSGKSSSGNNNSGNNNSGTNKGNTGTSNNPSGTSVQVTKGGISNTGVAGATVSGSTDNFIVKVTDDKTAADIALTALQNKFGDITQIKYLPMDISLYDSTGRTKIADTSGISVNLTLPLPDDLATYAGNNRIASVAGGVVEDLNSRFTTVDGVPCISFTASHFSPYVIYVDTANLTEKTIDYTPKTGDPIHPKWFLAIGLACVAVILFFKKDKVVTKKAKA